MIGEQQYLNLLREIQQTGFYREGRNGGTLGLFGRQIRFDLNQGFPLLTTKKVNLTSIIKELLWFLRGETNISTLGCGIWDSWADENGELGPIYGKQWRDWNGIDQIAQLVEGLKTDPHSRRHIVSAWNVAEIDQMALPPCHCLFQFFVAEGRLSCQLYQRSADMFLGVPFNIASYSLLTMMIARVTGLQLGEFVHTFGDVHIYMNHLPQVREQLRREPKDPPTMTIANRDDIFSYQLGDFRLNNYNCYPAIAAEVSK